MRLSGGIAPSRAWAKEPRVPFKERLTVKSRGRPEAPDQSGGRNLLSRASGDTTEPHGPLQRLLGGVQDRAPYWLRQGGFNEGTLGVEVVLARFVNYSHVAEARRLGVRNGHVDLAPLQGHLVSGVIDTNHQAF